MHFTLPSYCGNRAFSASRLSPWRSCSHCRCSRCAAPAHQNCIAAPAPGRKLPDDGSRLYFYRFIPRLAWRFSPIWKFQTAEKKDALLWQAGRSYIQTPFLRCKMLVGIVPNPLYAASAGCRLRICAKCFYNEKEHRGLSPKWEESSVFSV